MKVLFRALWIVFFLCGALSLKAETNSQRIADIRAVILDQETAWNRGDIDGFMNGYAQSAQTTFVSGDNVTRGWRTVRDRYKKKYANAEQMGRLRFSNLEITPLGRDTAVALGRWELRRKKDHPHGRFTLIFRRNSAGWRIVHDHTS